MRPPILLTGASGFIGKHVLRELNALDHLRIRIVCRPSHESVLSSICPHAELVFSPDLFSESANWWTNACAGISTILHLAWHTTPGDYLNSNKNIDCLKGTLSICQGAIEAGVNRFVGIGTCLEYAEQSTPTSILSPLGPRTLYATTKAATFDILSRWLPSTGMEFAWGRIYFISGDGEDERRLIPYVKNCLRTNSPAMLSHGLQTRDYIDSSTAAQVLAALAASNYQGATNICSGNGQTIRHMVEEIAKKSNQLHLLHFGAQPTNPDEPAFIVGIPGPFHGRPSFDSLVRAK